MTWTENCEPADHDREDDGDDGELFDDAQDDNADELYGGKQVDTAHWYITQKHVIRLILGWHQHHQQSLDKLHQQPAIDLALD